MFDHLDVTVSDLGRSEAFYARALAPLGIALAYRNPVNAAGGQTIGFGDSRDPAFCLRTGATPTSPIHIAFIAQSRAAVDGFHAAAIAAGGRDNGRPGPRTWYAPHYYSAFVLDPDGHNIEAVCRRET